MIILLILFSFIFLVFSIVFAVGLYYQRNQIKCNILSEKTLNSYLEFVCKKRKSIEKECKNSINKSKNVINYRYFHINLNFNNEIKNLKRKLSRENIVLFPEDVIRNNIGKIDNGFLFSNETYRGVKGKILILEIAKAYVFLSLNNTNFDMVKHFRSLTRQYVFYQKEIRILPKLVKMFFIYELCMIENDLYSSRLKIEKIKNTKQFIKQIDLFDDEIYALKKYSSFSTQIVLKHNVDANLSCYRFTCFLLGSLTKIRACLLWLEYL